MKIDLFICFTNRSLNKRFACIHTTARKRHLAFVIGELLRTTRQHHLRATRAIKNRDQHGGGSRARRWWSLLEPFSKTLQPSDQFGGICERRMIQFGERICWPNPYRCGARNYLIATRTQHDELTLAAPIHLQRVDE